MNIRVKITLWISGLVVCCTVLFSSVVFFEMLEHPFLLIDKELNQMADALLSEMEKNKSRPGEYDFSRMTVHPDNYWIKIYGKNGQILYRSKISYYTDILLSEADTYMVEKKINRNQIWLDQDDDDDVFFRVKIIEGSTGDTDVTVHIAKPIESIEKEIHYLFDLFLFSLCICVLFIVFISYRLAGKIIAPVSSITKLSREISEQSLDKRIPLTETKDELYHLSVSLNKMFDRLQYSFLRQKEFIGNASHELKSPITRLLLSQEDILINRDLEETVKEGLMKQLNTTRRMSQLVKQLLDLSRLEQQETLERERVNLSDLIKQAVDDYSEVFKAHGISLEKQISEALYLSGDKEKLYRLFINLIDNSIRYNIETNGRVIIKGWKTRSDIRFDFANTGTQIPEKDLALVFEQFYRVEKSRVTDHGGSGLGLSISKKIVQLHDGSIRITNISGGMIMISLVFPLR